MNKGCPKCGRMMDQTYKNCPYCTYDFKEINSFFKNFENEEYQEKKYAGFIKRIVAGLIDTYLISILILPLFIIKNREITNEKIILLVIIFLLIYILYNSILERSKFRGSFGKQILKIEVTDEYENPVTLGKAIKRNISKIFNLLTLTLGFLMCAFSQKKQTLGDKIANTYVVNKIELKEEKIIQTAHVSKRIIAFIIDLINIVILIAAEYYIINYLSRIATILEIIIKYKEILPKAIAIIIIAIYFPYSESKQGKTKGKKILKIKVTDMEEEKISFTLSIIRFLLIILDIITLGILLPLVESKRQTLKDIITKTIVIDD